MIKNIIDQLKFKIIRLIEQNPNLNLFIYNKIHYFKFLFPHEKDYLALNLIFKKSDHKKVFLDIGANIGLSIIGFRKMGFIKNKILAFEPQIDLCKRYLQEIRKKDKNLIIFNYGLSDKNQKKTLFTPFINNYQIHYLCSFDKNYLVNRLKLTYKKHFKKFIIKESKFILKKFDNLNIKYQPDFIKIDAEGYDHLILYGMKKLIRTKKPIFLIEYNTENFKKITKILKNYLCYKYNITKNRLQKLNNNELNYYKNLKKIKFNLNYSRNFYFLPK